MASLTVRNLDDDVKQKLRVRAASKGRSMEAEVRIILSDAIEENIEERGFGTALRELFAPLGGIELDIPPRDDMDPDTSIFDE